MNVQSERNCRSLIEVLSRHLLCGTGEITKNFNQNSQYAGRDSNEAPPEYVSGVLPLDQPARPKIVRESPLGNQGGDGRIILRWISEGNL